MIRPSPTDFEVDRIILPEAKRSSTLMWCVHIAPLREDAAEYTLTVKGPLSKLPMIEKESSH